MQKVLSFFFFFSTMFLKSTYPGILSSLVTISVEHMTGKTELFRAVGFKESEWLGYFCRSQTSKCAAVGHFPIARFSSAVHAISFLSQT